MTKVHEQFVRGTLAELAQDRAWIGEITIVLGAHERSAAAIDDAALDARIDEELRTGAHAKTVARRVSAWSGRPQREIYQRVIARKR
jgi:16S rRNA C1402 (ribose-2'-O) methylase RsmI